MPSEISQQIIQTITQPSRTKLLETPADYDMEFDAVTLTTEDGVRLSAWEIRTGSNKLAIINHPLYCSKYGFYPEGPIKDLVPVHVKFLPMVKHLVDAGFNILTYDLRNNGESETPPNGISGIGHFEWRDVVGAMSYVASHDDFKKMDVALVSQCMGGNAAILALHKRPEAFSNVKALFTVQTIAMRYMVEQLAGLLGDTQPSAVAEDVDAALRSTYGFSLDDMSPEAGLASLPVPVFFSQVRQDALTRPADIQGQFERAGSEQKEFFWIEGDLNRFDGYNYFGQNPEKMVGFLNKHM